MISLFGLMAMSLVLAVGCSTRHNLGSTGGAKLERGQQTCIITPADGSYGSKLYPGSGAITASLLQGALTSYAGSVKVLTVQDDVQAGLKQASGLGCHYVFHPQILNWEPRAASWSARPTKVHVLMNVYDLKKGRDVLISQSLESTGRSITFISQHPSEILKDLFLQFASQSF
jgi:hypothetical protein